MQLSRALRQFSFATSHRLLQMSQDSISLLLKVTLFIRFTESAGIVQFLVHQATFISMIIESDAFTWHGI